MAFLARVINVFVVFSLGFVAVVAAEGIYKKGDVVLGALLTVRHKNSDDSCGALKPQGLAYVEAMLYAIESLNRDNKLLPNITVGYDIVDSCDSPALANKEAFEFVTRNQATQKKFASNDTKNFKKFFGELRNPVAAVIGAGDSSSSVVVASMLQVGNISQISPFATSEELSLQYFRTFFRPVPPDGQQAKALADVIDYFGWKYVMVIGVDTSYGRYGVMALENESQERSTFCISEISYFPPSGYQNKIKTIVSKIKRAENVKAVVLWGGPTTSIHFIQEAYRQGIYGKTWLAPEGWSEATPLFKEKYLPIIGGFVGTKLRNYNLDKFYQHMLKLDYSYQRVRNHTWWKEFWMHEKQCQSESECNFQDFRISPKTYNNMYTAYLAYVIDAVYSVAHALDAIYHCNETENAECPSTKPFLRAKEVLRYMSNVTFKGITGSVEFNKKGDSISSAAYDIVNLHAGTNGPELKIIGNWDRGHDQRLKIDNSSLYWNNGSNNIPVSICIKPCSPGYLQTATVACCWKCIRCPIGFISNSYSSPNCTECPLDKMPDRGQRSCIDLPEVNVTFYDSQSIAILIVAGIEFLAVVFVLAVGIRYRSTPIVKSSNREMSVLFLFGIVVGIIAGVIQLARPNELICYFPNPLHALYYTLCLSILLVKTNRLVKIFEFSFVTSSIGQLCNSKHSQFLILFLLNGIAGALVTIWHVFDPPYVYVTIEPLRMKHLGCKNHKDTLGLALQGTLYAYQLALSVLCAYYAFKARNLPANFSEARYIAFAMYMQLLCTICYATLQNSVEGNFLTTFSSAIVVLSSYGFLICMFAPKIYIILKSPEKNTTEYVKALVANHSLDRGFSRVNVVGKSKFASSVTKGKLRSETFTSSMSNISSGDGERGDSKKLKTLSVSFQDIVEEAWDNHKSSACSLKNSDVAKETQLNENGARMQGSENPVISNGKIKETQSNQNRGYINYADTGSPIKLNGISKEIQANANANGAYNNYADTGSPLKANGVTMETKFNQNEAAFEHTGTGSPVTETHEVWTKQDSTGRPIKFSGVNDVIENECETKTTLKENEIQEEDKVSIYETCL